MDPGPSSHRFCHEISRNHRKISGIAPLGVTPNREYMAFAAALGLTTLFEVMVFRRLNVGGFWQACTRVLVACNSFRALCTQGVRRSARAHKARGWSPYRSPLTGAP